MKIMTGVLILLSMATSAFASEIFSRAYDCQNGEKLLVALDLKKHLPAKASKKEYCSSDEQGSRTCDMAYLVNDAMTATWTIQSTIKGLGSFEKSFPLEMMIFPTNFGNQITLVNELGLHIPEIRINQDRYLSFHLGASLSHKTRAMMENDVLVDLVELEDISMNAGVIEYESNSGEFEILCNI